MLSDMGALAGRHVSASSRFWLRGAREAFSVGAFVLFASALVACGSKDDLVLGSNDFVLLRRDEFDALDLDFWELATHTFPANYAWFTPANAEIRDGELVLSITADPAPTDAAAGEEQKPYSAAELRTRAPFLYGRFRTRARLAAGSGILSAFWGFYDRYSMSTGPAIDNQIVTEAVNAPEQELRHTVVAADIEPQTEVLALDSDPTEAFHVLGYDWTPSEVRFYWDGQVQASVGGEVAEALTQYQRLVLSAYPSRAAGPFDDTILPVEARFDWVEIYEFTGPRP